MLSDQSKNTRNAEFFNTFRFRFPWLFGFLRKIFGISPNRGAKIYLESQILPLSPEALRENWENFRSQTGYPLPFTFLDWEKREEFLPESFARSRMVWTWSLSSEWGPIPTRLRSENNSALVRFFRTALNPLFFFLAMLETRRFRPYLEKRIREWEINLLRPNLGKRFRENSFQIRKSNHLPEFLMPRRLGLKSVSFQWGWIKKESILPYTDPKQNLFGIQSGSSERVRILALISEPTQVHYIWGRKEWKTAIKLEFHDYFLFWEKEDPEEHFVSLKASPDLRYFRSYFSHFDLMELFSQIPTRHVSLPNLEPYIQTDWESSMEIQEIRFQGTRWSIGEPTGTGRQKDDKSGQSKFYYDLDKRNIDLAPKIFPGK